MTFRKEALIPILLVPLTVFACGPTANSDENDADRANGSNPGISEGLNNPGSLTFGGGAEGEPNQGAAPAEGCGDGVLDPEKEICDDGNNVAGDGCWANCLNIERGFICNTNEASLTVCNAVAKCGDGVIIFPEQCDDGARENGDGCSENCKEELGYKCDETGCSTTTCGDGIVEGSETCDNGPDVPGDGCSAACIGEPDCSGGSCTSQCGDGIVLNEECDDGNLQDGDGCSSECIPEAGYTCAAEAECTRSASGECQLAIPAVFRDFSSTHPDFESCQMNAGGTGMVKDALENGIPAAKSPGVCKNVADWFTDSAENSKHVAEVILYDNGNGGYVNRWGANGEQWEGPPAADIICGYSGPAADNCGGCSSYDPDIHECYINGTNEAGEASPQGCGATSCVAKITRDYHDGNPFFFPVDGIDGALDNGGSVARVGPAGPGYWKANGTYPTEAQALGLSEPVLRNFHFTTEITYWFPYAANTNAKLEFSGDDDVWVFLNGKLAVDIGGLHEPLDGSVTIDSTTAANYGLSAGNVYEIKVFHAERQTDGSTFKLTLSGFDATRSDCEATCGDGIIGFGEECDDGQNNGGYNQCNAECTLGAYCGDGIQQENEDCDDADPNSGGNCRNCRNLILR